LVQAFKQQYLVITGKVNAVQNKRASLQFA